MPPCSDLESVSKDSALPPDCRVVAPLKRTRLNVVQSKHGCLTCKLRKIKCDETHPRCLRCERAQKTCLGYAHDSVPQSHSNHTSTATQSLVVLARPPSSDDKMHPFGSNYNFARYACQVMDRSIFGNATWSQYLPQLCEQNVSVMRAAAALGAVLTANASRDLAHHMHASRLYSVAISTLQKELESAPNETLHLIISTILLAGVEIVNNSSANALNHILGTYKLLEMNKKSKEVPTKSDSSILIHELASLCYRMDLQISTFALGRAPDLTDIHSFSHIVTFEQRLHLDLHSGYSFCHSLLGIKYRPEQVSSETLIQICRRLGNLAEWLELLKERETQEHHALTKNCTLTLRCQCLSLIIYMSSIMRPDELAYDVQAPHFQQIVRDAEVVLQEPSPLRFTSEPGIIHPLFLTALKYRDRTWRRKAIQLMQRSGREGPWSGPIMARVAERVVDLEESGGAGHIGELQRLHGTNLTMQFVDSQRQSLTCSFSRCRDLEKMLKCEESEQKQYWEIWDEYLGLT